MPKQPSPRKRSPLLSMATFPKHGPAYQTVERLPETKEELEDVVVSKFVAALREQEGQNFVKLVRGDPWPDYEVQEGNERIGIEVVEIVNVEHRQKAQLQEQYATQVAKTLNDIYPRLSGLEIILDDGYQDPQWPALNTEMGQQLVQKINVELRTVVNQLESIKVGCLVGYRWQGTPGQLRMGAFCRRFAPVGSGTPSILKFQGTFPATEATNQALLKQAIERKLLKRYSKYPKGKLWLVAYCSQGWHFADPHGVAIAQEALKSQPHPFSDIWEIFIGPKPSAIIQRIYP